MKGGGAVGAAVFGGGAVISTVSLVLFLGPAFNQTATPTSSGCTPPPPLLSPPPTVCLVFCIVLS